MESSPTYRNATVHWEPPRDADDGPCKGSKIAVRWPANWPTVAGPRWFHGVVESEDFPTYSIMYNNGHFVKDALSLPWAIMGRDSSRRAAAGQDATWRRFRAITHPVDRAFTRPQYGQELRGKTIEVFFAEEEPPCWVRGDVIKFIPSTGLHEVKYLLDGKTTKRREEDLTALAASNHWKCTGSDATEPANVVPEAHAIDGNATAHVEGVTTAGEEAVAEEIDVDAVVEEEANEKGASEDASGAARVVHESTDPNGLDALLSAAAAQAAVALPTAAQVNTMRDSAKRMLDKCADDLRGLDRSVSGAPINVTVVEQTLERLDEIKHTEATCDTLLETLRADMTSECDAATRAEMDACAAGLRHRAIEHLPTARDKFKRRLTELEEDATKRRKHAADAANLASKLSLAF
jgi:hypothetical protein